MRISIIKIPVRYDDVRAYTCMCTCLCMCILSSACNVCVWLRERERNACSGENRVHTRLSEKSFRTERGGGRGGKEVAEGAGERGSHSRGEKARSSRVVTAVRRVNFVECIDCTLCGFPRGRNILIELSYIVRGYARL